MQHKKHKAEQADRQQSYRPEKNVLYGIVLIVLNFTVKKLFNNKFFHYSLILVL